MAKVRAGSETRPAEECQLEGEAATFVKIDPTDGWGVVAVVEVDGALEDVGVVAVVGACWIGMGDAQQIAPLGGAGGLPALDEFRD